MSWGLQRSTRSRAAAAPRSILTSNHACPAAPLLLLMSLYTPGSMLQHADHPDNLFEAFHFLRHQLQPSRPPAS